MRTFLKNIRRTILSDEGFRRYIPYAVGEIVLVVIGILIALQINNWNQDKIARQKEQLLLTEIHEEFLRNQSELEAKFDFYRRLVDKATKITAMFPIHIDSVNLDSLGAHLRGLDFNGALDLSLVSLESLKSTSSHELISDKRLRSLLIQMDELVADYTEREQASIRFGEDSYFPYMNAHIPFPYQNGLKDPRVDLSFLETIEFENLVKTRATKVHVFLMMIRNDEAELMKTVKQIVKLTAI